LPLSQSVIVGRVLSPRPRPEGPSGEVCLQSRGLPSKQISPLRPTDSGPSVEMTCVFICNFYQQSSHAPRRTATNTSALIRIADLCGTSIYFLRFSSTSILLADQCSFMASMIFRLLLSNDSLSSCDRMAVLPTGLKLGFSISVKSTSTFADSNERFSNTASTR